MILIFFPQLAWHMTKTSPGRKKCVLKIISLWNQLNLFVSRIKINYLFMSKIWWEKYFTRKIHARLFFSFWIKKKITFFRFNIKNLQIKKKKCGSWLFSHTWYFLWSLLWNFSCSWDHSRLRGEKTGAWKKMVLTWMQSS